MAYADACLPASFCTIVSVAGVIVLAIFGYGFSHNWPALMGSKKNPENGAAVGMTCYMSALVYAVFVAFCGLQLNANRRYQRIQLS